MEGRHYRILLGIGFLLLFLDRPTGTYANCKANLEDMGYLADGGDEAQALRNFQTFYGLPVTGVCDMATLELITMRRCGNPDDGSALDPTAPHVPLVAPFDLKVKAPAGLSATEMTDLQAAMLELTNSDPRLTLSLTTAGDADIPITFVQTFHGNVAFDGAGGVTGHVVNKEIHVEEDDHVSNAVTKQAFLYLLLHAIIGEGNSGDRLSARYCFWDPNHPGTLTPEDKAAIAKALGPITTTAAATTTAAGAATLPPGATTPSELPFGLSAPIWAAIITAAALTFLICMSCLICCCVRMCPPCPGIYSRTVAPRPGPSYYGEPAYGGYNPFPAMPPPPPPLPVARPMRFHIPPVQRSQAQIIPIATTPTTSSSSSYDWHQLGGMAF